MRCRLAAMAGTLALWATSAVAQGGIHKQADFNGDGFADLAIGAPGETYSLITPTLFGKITTTYTGAGVVNVAFGSPSGLGARNQLLSRKGELSSSIFKPQGYAHFGNALAWGDFNKDGFTDLAVGVPGDNKNEGSVDVYSGSANGLVSYPLHLRLPYMRFPQPANTTGFTWFGQALAVGDVNGDGFADLAISQNTGVGNRGAVYVVPGGPTGLKPSAAQTLMDSSYIQHGGPFCLAFGDFNGDGHDDLAMGFPYEAVNGIGGAGFVEVAYGTAYGIDSNPQYLHQDSPGMLGVCEVGDHFGSSLVAADFNRDGKWDLAIGVPGENTNTGVVHVQFGQPDGLSISAAQIWSRDSAGVYKDPTLGDRFGEALAAADVDSDGYPELIVGIPGDNANAGGIQVLTILAGPLGARHAFWNQASYQVLGIAEAGDRFGAALAVGDYNGDGRLDVAIGAPGENNWTGAVNILYGAGSGLSWPNNQLLMQGLNGMLETQEPNDLFGRL
jgi:hypothetical protein